MVVSVKHTFSLYAVGIRYLHDKVVVPITIDATGVCHFLAGMIETDLLSRNVYVYFAYVN